MNVRRISFTLFAAVTLYLFSATQSVAQGTATVQGAIGQVGGGTGISPKHKECVPFVEPNGSISYGCQELEGAGENRCGSDDDCFVNKCVPGKGCTSVAKLQGGDSSDCEIGYPEACRSSRCIQGNCIKSEIEGRIDCETPSDCHGPGAVICSEGVCVKVDIEPEVGAFCMGREEGDECDQHTKCNGDECVVVGGIGRNECKSSAECRANRWHLECKDKQCTSVDGPGPDKCHDSMECVDKVCRPNMPDVCYSVSGTGKIQPECLSFGCHHFQCQNQTCTRLPGPGDSNCLIQGDGNSAPCKHGVCGRDGENLVCKLVDGAGESECEDNNDCFHRECRENTCVAVAGPGEDTCEVTGVQCTHIDCVAPFGTFTCQLVNGAGVNAKGCDGTYSIGQKCTRNDTKTLSGEAGSNGATSTRTLQLPIDQGMKFGSPEGKTPRVDLVCDTDCPFCGDVFPLLKEMSTKGQIRLIHFNAPFHTNSMRASAAVVCAGKSGRAQEMLGLLYRDQRHRSDESLTKLATSLGIEKKAFETCLNSDAAKAEVEKEYKFISSFGINSTPTILINGTQYRGPRTEKGVLDAIKAGPGQLLAKPPVY